ncbi:hypothetical protein [Wolbachia pipientis]
MIGELIFAFSRYKRSERFLRKLEQNNEKKT